MNALNIAIIVSGSVISSAAVVVFAVCTAAYAESANAEVYATVKKNIEPYNAQLMNNWYLLSLPVDYETPDFSPFITNSAYDLFYYSQNFPGTVVDETSENGEWRNYKYYLQNGMEFKADYNGYLYANQENTILNFTGTLYSEEDMEYLGINYNNSADENQIGINLLGNPYTCNAIADPGRRIDGYYMMNESRDDVIAVDENADVVVVAPMTALFAIANRVADAASVTFIPTTNEGDIIVRNNGVEYMKIELTANGVLKDRVYVKAGEGNNCIKFNLNENSTKIFVPQNNKNYAIAYTDGANVMPLCFTTKQNGIYTLNFNTKNMNYSYLHLIDNVTGVDIDLFQTPSYTFNSSDSNYANRFKLVFSEEATNEIAESFAFISNGELMINNSGNATLQIMDITGRILSTDNIQNCYSKSLNLSAGVYVVRLSNGNDVKAQKIVVE